MTIATFLRYIPPFPRGLAEVGGPSRWGGVWSGQVAEVLKAFEVGVGDGAAAYNRAGVSKLGDLGLADFGVGGEQHHLVTGLGLVGLVRTLTTGWIGLFSDWVGVLTGRRCATARSFY